MTSRMEWRKIPAVRFDLRRQWQRAVSSTPHLGGCGEFGGIRDGWTVKMLWRESAELIQ